MKKLISYILICSFIVQSTSQFWILASFIVHKEFITKNICLSRYETLQTCNGKCFLLQEFQEDEKKQTQQFPEMSKKEIQLFVNTILPILFISHVTPFCKKKLFKSEDSLLTGYSFSVFHPPQIV